MRNNRTGRATLIMLLACAGGRSSVASGPPVAATAPAAPVPIDVGSRRQLLVDHYLVDQLTGSATLRLNRPVDRGEVLAFDKPWEGAFSAYVTVLDDGHGKLQAFYRGSPAATDTWHQQVVCYAESADGVRWTKPALDLFPRDAHPATNIILADAGADTHNFAPFLDTRPGVPPAERYKAVGGHHAAGLHAYASPDGIHWNKLQADPVLTRQVAGSAGSVRSTVFDSQNVPFWSAAEGKYLLYYRVYKDRVRRIARVESDDFVHWANPVLMEYRAADGRPAPIEQLYTSQTVPYFRAPDLYVATAARFMPGRRVLTTRQAGAIHVDPKYFNDTSDAVFMTSRGGTAYDRTFMEALVVPGIGWENWTSRTNYPARGVVQTGPAEMSIYLNQNYGQPTAHLRRYSLRLDGFASVRAEYVGGEMVTRPLVFAGSALYLNAATSAAGTVRVEIQDAHGQPLPGFALADCREVIGNEIERQLEFAGGPLDRLAGTTVRLRFVMKDADVYALRFGETAAAK